MNKSGGRSIWDKVMACCFCPAVLKNKISEHLAMVHSMESDVSRILLKKPGSSDRKLGWERLTNLGNFNHNVAALSSGTGEIIVKRHSSHILSPDYFLPHEYCYGFVSFKLLWKHVKCCHFRVTSADNYRPHSVVARAQVLLESVRPVMLLLFQQVIHSFFCDSLLTDIWTAGM